MEEIGDMDWLRQWARLAPNSVAFVDGESISESSSSRHYRYGELYALTCALAAHLSTKWRIGKGDRVAMLATTEIEAVALFFATLRLGAILVPVNFRLTAPEIMHVLEDSEPALLISQQDFASVLSTIGDRLGGLKCIPDRRWSFDGSDSLKSFIDDFLKSPSLKASKIRADVGLPPVEMNCEAEEPCMILYTSGTTGKPKGAMITPKMLFWNSLNTTLRLNIQQSDVFVSFLPLFHTGGWNVLLTPFVHRGAKTVLLKKFDADRILELCGSQRATILFGVPTTMEMMARSKRFGSTDLSSIRYAIVGGEPMPIELIKTWQEKGIPIRQGFGLTEFGPNVFSLNEEDSIRKIGSIGFPNFYIKARVVDDHGKDVAQGEIGELILQGPVCSPGYWRNESATREAIRDGWMHTGDLVRYDDEGYFFVAGRKKDMFISGGENVYPVEIERVLSQHPEIREVAVIGVPDPKWGEVGRAFVVTSPGARLNSDDIIAFCADKLAKFKIPKQVEFRSELPKGDSGKILKRVLKESAATAVRQ